MYKTYIKYLMAMMIILLNLSTAAATPENEYALKAAYIFQFIKFTKGLNEEEDTLNIGLHVDKSMEGVFKKYNNKKTRNGIINFVIIEDWDNLGACCEVIYFATKPSEQELQKIKRIPLTTILTIIDDDLDVQENGIIYFVRKGTKLKFKVNLGSARQAGINFDSHLLNIAVEVID